MYSPIEAHQRGLDEGMEVALTMLNETLGINAESLGQAIAHVEIMRRQLERLKLELTTDWK